MAEQKPAFGWAARDSSGVLSPFDFTRRSNGDEDVTLKVLYCGICHTDLGIIKNEFGNSMYPVVPGHEIVGVVTEVGSNVQRFKIGDKVGVGYVISSCTACDTCKHDFENYCPKLVPTSNGIYIDGKPTYGGFSDLLVANERYVLRLPDNLPLEKIAPLLCAGVTVYTPMKYHGLNEPGKHLGAVGLGGLGHVAVKFGKALGMKVTVISTSLSKEKEAIEQLGADAFLISRDPDQMKSAMGTMDGIIDTVAASHPIVPLIYLLKAHGKLIMVGVVLKPMEIPVVSLIQGGRSISGSNVGGMKDTQEMLDFAGKHNVTADVEVIGMDYVNTAMERLEKGDVRYRFVIDVANTIGAAPKAQL
ncbi:putative cinnamyl-alcohol dehydrogenase [Dioscorea sansibarensis]